MEHYSHIQLTDEEEAAAILEAKAKKAKLQEYEETQRRAAENRRALTETSWSYEQTSSYMLYRAKTLFEDKPFTLDHHNQIIFDLMCYYFSRDARFEATAGAMGIKNPSLTKGLFLAGNFGVGKTWLMKLFQKNQRQVFFMRNAKQIADAFSVEGEEGLRNFVVPFKNPTNDSALFYQPQSGLCIDDLGTEDMKQHYGNKLNVIGDVIEKRYAAGYVGDLLHATTNLTAEQLSAFYGERVISRMREIFNYIELPGEDRRK